MNSKIVIIGADHNGVELKHTFCEKLKDWGFIPIDIGPYDKEHSVDYVDYANQVSHIVGSNPEFRGVLICGTGVGMSIAANRFSKVRAALVHNSKTAPKCREHNDSNILCLGSWVVESKTNEDFLKTWLTEPYAEGRHNSRIAKLTDSPNKIIFTNGVFDILHAGHLALLQFSKRLGDKLVVAINSDSSVRKLKGDNRPVNNEDNRKKLLESLVEVDEVIIFDSDLEDVRNHISPDVVVKGGEWTSEEVRVRDNIPDNIEIKLFPIVDDYSTTNTIKKIQGLDSWNKK